MRTYVSKMLIGAPIVVGSPAAGEVAVAPWGAINALLSEGTALPIAAPSDQFGFVKAYQGKSGLEYITAGPFSSSTAEINDNQAIAGVAKVVTLTVDLTNSEVGDVFLVKVAYHDNLSIIPNQIKFTHATAVYETGDTASTIAAKLRAAFTAQEFIFVNISGDTDKVIFTSQTLLTASQYNSIDRPEVVNFEVSIPEQGSFSVADTTALKVPRGTAAQIAWQEEQHMGRLGYADRRMWNNTKKYQSQLVDGVSAYDTLVISDNKNVEGDMQNIRHNPIGAVVAAADNAAWVTALGTIGATVVAIP